MSRTLEAPTVHRDDGPMGGEIYEHPAYGTITMTSSSNGNIGTLFGSDIQHHQCIRISIQRAKLHRSLSHDWVHGECRSLVEFEMSHAQFAEFITSVGNGSGTPITLTAAPDQLSRTVSVPGIENIETKHELFRREIRESAKGQADRINREIEKLGALIASGKVGKKDLSAIYTALRSHAGNLPGNLAFTVAQAEEALEKATTHAKVEVEAYISNTARRLGLSSLAQLAQLEDKSDGA